MIVDSIKLAEVVDIDILMRRHARVLKVQVLIPPAAFAQFNWQEQTSRSRQICPYGKK
jgi:hypothetical protein